MGHVSIECDTMGPSPYLSCLLPDGSGSASIWLYGWSATLGVQLTCTLTTSSYIQLQNGVTSGPYNIMTWDIMTFYLHVPSVSLVTCDTSADNGDIDLFMNWDDSSEYYDCEATSGSPTESCTMGPREGVAYIFVLGFYETYNFDITCYTSPLGWVNE